MNMGDLRVRIGTYTGADGKEKGRYVTVGNLHQGQDGSFYGSLQPFVDLGTLLAMQRADNRARNRTSRDDISFAVYASNASNAGGANTNAAAYASATGGASLPSPPPPLGADDDIPF